MNRTRITIRTWMTLLLVLGCCACGPQSDSDVDQTFAVLGPSDELAFPQARPGKPLRFPADHGAHPEYRLEWWYLTANLTDETGASLGIQWTLFRQAMTPQPEQPGWQSNQFYMAHVALTDAQDHQAEERFARGGVGIAGVSTQPFRAWLENWSLRSSQASFLPLELAFTVDDRTIALTLSGDSTPVLNGVGGFSQKHPDKVQGSYYYSMPRLEVTGVISEGQSRRRVSGHAWLDREWSSSFLTEEQQGWDWVALRLDDGAALMLYRLRHNQGDDYLSGTWISADGRSVPLDTAALRWRSTQQVDVAGRALPLYWQLDIPQYDVSLQISPLQTQSWMEMRFPYWEGPVFATGSHQAEGYLELTGY